MANGQSTILLKKAKSLIEQGWCQKSYAKNSNGVSCDPLGEDAASYCCVGALLKSEDIISGGYYEAVQRLHDVVGNIVSYNDTHNREEVLAAFDKAIANGQ